MIRTIAVALLIFGWTTSSEAGRWVEHRGHHYYYDVGSYYWTDATTWYLWDGISWQIVVSPLRLQGGYFYGPPPPTIFPYRIYRDPRYPGWWRWHHHHHHDHDRPKPKPKPTPTPTPTPKIDPKPMPKAPVPKPAPMPKALPKPITKGAKT